RLHEAGRLPAQVLTAAAEIAIRRVLLAAALTRPHDSTFFFAAFTRRRYVLCTGLYCSMQRAIAACIVSSTGTSQYTTKLADGFSAGPGRPCQITPPLSS